MVVVVIVVVRKPTIGQEYKPILLNSYLVSHDWLVFNAGRSYGVNDKR